ncbi:MAG: metal-dependent transcriptional regulator [Ilumatobacteraceae bacterium]|jgi:DtxR family Mn-dependent transcriptional regulator|nr:metal-dependent transcriptional regulator [Gammaproteobacteria bacterium]
MATPGEHHPAFEEYCECIFELREDNVEIIQARLVERLGVSRPSVSEMIKRMESEGLVSIRGQKITLTHKGDQLAERVVRRHRIAERFLTDVLKLSWSQAHHEACKWEHVISADVERALNTLLGSPTTCPHGNPIPGSQHRDERVAPLETVHVGDSFTVSRIPEELEVAPGMLDLLESSKFYPGAVGTVVAGEMDGSRTVRVADRDITLDGFATARIMIQA